MKFTKILMPLLLLVMSAGGAVAQGAQVPFGGLLQDTSLPVEIAADSLTINQAEGTASFVGNVVIGQGEMRLSAARVQVEYAASGNGPTGRISRLVATGGVTLVNGSETAEAREAEYSINTGVIILSGGVILTQGQNALSADKMILDLASGTATLQGRVRSVLQVGGN
ncbi:MAG: LptA/OstA family protein [Paracoccaceae bacterium]